MSPYPRMQRQRPRPYRGRLAATCVTIGLAAGLGATLVACSTSDRAAPAVQPPAATAATAGSATGSATAESAMEASAGTVCAGAAGSSISRAIDVNGRTRTFIEHVPAGFSADRRYPAIIAFPGRGESARELQTYSQLDGIGAIVLYAQGLPGAGGLPSWESTPYQSASAHDYEFAADLVQLLVGSSCVDQDHIDMTGKSDGAGFAASAACGIPQIAAVATISGAFYQGENHCAAAGRPLSILNMHGTADPVVPYDGSSTRGLYATGSWLELWQRRDQCAGPGTSQSIAPDVIRTTWPSCADGTEVVNDRIIGGGHTWPGATVASGPGATTHSIDAAQVMAAFFAAHPWHRAGR
jgi:polyhydroxybutyrate depolymerase